MRAGLLLFCLLPPCLAGCASAPQAGDLSRADRSRADVRTLIEQKVIRADAKGARLRPEALTGWRVTHVPITPELLAGEAGSNYVHTREVDLQCRYSMFVPVFIRHDPAKQRFYERDLFEFGGGDCYELVAPDAKLITYLSIFNLSVDLDTAIPKEKRSERIWLDGLGYLENTSYKTYHNERTDRHGWEAQNVTVAEAAGYYYESFGLGHIPVFSPKRNNYYRMLLMGKHTIVLVATIGPTSASLGELQEAMLPVLKGLRYDGDKPAVR